MIDYVKEKYFQLASSNLDIEQKTLGDSDIANFSCPFCKEGNSLGRKKRAFIYKETGHSFYCFNCQLSYSFEYFLRELDPQLFKQYFAENKSSLEKTYMPKKKKEKPQSKPDDVVFMKFDKDFVRAVSVSEALDYIEKRKIPKKYWKTILYYAGTAKKPYSHSIIFPLTKDNKPYGFISRKIKSKFFHIHLANSNNPKIYNYYNANKDLLCYITESIIDSLYLKNSVALNGAGLSKKLLSKFRNPVFVFDNDNTGKTKTKRMIDKGYKVFIMPKELSKYKDLNDLARAGVDEKIIQKIVYVNTFSGKEALIRIALSF